MTETLPSYDQLPIRDGAPAQSKWGDWGDHDDLGTLNLLTNLSIGHLDIGHRGSPSSGGSPR